MGTHSSLTVSGVLGIIWEQPVLVETLLQARLAGSPV